MPNGRAAESAALRICTRSPPPFCTSRRVTGVAAPVHPARMLFGSIASLKVKVIVSPVSARPVVPPDTFVVWMFVPVGTVLSTVTENPLVVPLLPPTSVAVIVNAFEVALRGLDAVCDAVR